MKRLVNTVVFLVLVVQCRAFASGDLVIDISYLSKDQLIALKAATDARLIELGIYPFIALERNDKGEEVERLQKRLAELNYLSYVATGKYDSSTQLAQKAFEKQNGLDANGNASVDDQRLLFSAAAVAKSIPTPSPTKKPIATPDPIKNEYKTIDYDEYARYPEKYLLQKVFLKGKVEQVLGTREDGFQVRLSVLNNTSNIVYVFINEDPGYNILDGDKLNVYAKLFNTITYKSIWGQSITIPAAYADIVELH